MKTLLKLAFIGSVLISGVAHAESDPQKVNQCNWSSINNNIDSAERRKMCYAQPEYVLCMDTKMGSNITRPDAIPDDHLREMISMCSQSSGYVLNNNAVKQQSQLVQQPIQQPDIVIRELPPVPQQQAQQYIPLQANGPLSQQWIPSQQTKPRYDDPPQSSASRSTDPLDICYENKIKKFDSSKESKEYEARMGFPRGINQDQINEWKSECSRSIKKPAKVKHETTKHLLGAQNDPDKKNDVYAKIESCIDTKIGKSKPSNEALQKYSQQCAIKYNKPEIIDVPVSRVESTYSKGERNVQVHLEIKI